MPYAAMMFVVLFWGSAAAVGRLMGTDESALTLSIWRVQLGFALLLAIQLLVMARHRTGGSPALSGKPAFRSYIPIWISGIFGYGIMIWLFFFAARTTLASHLVLILSAAPIGTLLLNRVLDRSGRLSGRSLVATTVSLLGIVIMVPLDLTNEGASLKGDLLGVAAMLAFSLYTIGIKRYGKGFTSMQINLNGMLAGLVFLWVVSAAVGNPFLPASFNGIGRWSGILYLGLFSTGLAYFLYSWAISKLPMARVLSFIYLQPVVGVSISLIGLDEPLTLRLVLGMGFIMAGLLLNLIQTTQSKRSGSET